MKQATRSIVAVLCAALLLWAALPLLPAARAEQENVGDAEISAGIKNLEIEWTSGKVTIAYHSGSAVMIQEKITGLVSQDQRLRWALDGDTLRIRYDKPGFHLFSFLSFTKELTVTLPEDLILREARITAESAALILPDLRAENLYLSTKSGDIQARASARVLQASATSGDIVAQVMSDAEEVSLAVKSGKITLETAYRAEAVNLSATSGGIRAAIREAGQMQISTKSGDIQAVVGSVKQAECKSTSGDVTLEIAAWEALSVQTTSGSVTAALPASPGFTARIQTASGRIKQTMGLTRQGKDYFCGDGSAAVTIHTTSGSVTISEKE